MAALIREPASIARETYDLIIVGGGIYGAMLSLEASRGGLRSLLLEREDFGGATSFNSLRIIHGGLRYLQRMDLRRFRESLGERRWFLRTFSNLIEPLPCLMPLYGDGLKRPVILKIALQVNNLLSWTRNKGVNRDHHLPAGKTIDAKKTRDAFSDVDTRGLQGGAVWYDAFMPDSQRLLIDILRSARAEGATALNYVEAQGLLTTRAGVAGVVAIDHESNKTYEYKAKAVVNASGPWCRALGTKFHRDVPRLFRSSLAWNVLFNRKAVSDYAIAIFPRVTGGRVYFLLPWKGMLLAGTGHAPWYGSVDNPMPSRDQLQAFLDDVNLAVPKLHLMQDEILHVFAGLLPVKKAGTIKLSAREVIFDHGKNGGPSGLFSVSGVKFTTARLVAQKTIDKILSEKSVAKEARTTTFQPPQYLRSNRGIFDFDWRPTENDTRWENDLYRLIREESVQHLDDLIFRRTTLWENPWRAREIASRLCPLFDWDDFRCGEEIKRLNTKFLFSHSHLNHEILQNKSA